MRERPGVEYVRLERPGGSFPFPAQSWALALRLAEEYGWRPDRGGQDAVSDDAAARLEVDLTCVLLDALEERDPALLGDEAAIRGDRRNWGRLAEFVGGGAFTVRPVAALALVGVDK